MKTIKAIALFQIEIVGVKVKKAHVLKNSLETEGKEM